MIAQLKERHIIVPVADGDKLSGNKASGNTQVGSDDLQKSLNAYCDANGIERPKMTMRQYLSSKPAVGLNCSRYIVLKGYKQNPQPMAWLQYTSWGA